MAAARFVERLNEQIGYEFAASQQYIANAVFSRLDAQCALDAQSVPGKRQRVVQSPGSSTGGFGSGTGSGSGVTGTTIASTTTRAPVVSTTQPPAPTTTTCFI